MADTAATGGRLERVGRVTTRVAGDRRFQVGFIAAAVAAAVVAVILDRQSFLAAARQLGAASVALALVLTIVNVTAAAATFRAVLGDLGSPLRVREAFRIFLVGGLGKYLPGSVWFIVAQAEIASRVDVPRRRAAAASTVTLVVSVATAALASLLVVPVAPAGLPAWFRWSPLLLPVLVLALTPPLLNRLLDRLLRAFRQEPLEHRLGAPGVAVAVGWSLLSWLAVGGQVAVLALTVGAPLEWRTLVLCLGGYALAWAAGFAAVVAPAGAGAREAVLLVVLTGVLAPGSALVVVLVSRVLLTLADLGVAAVFGLVPRPPVRATGGTGRGGSPRSLR